MMLHDPKYIDLLHQARAAISEQEGGASKSERAKKANALAIAISIELFLSVNLAAIERN